MARHFKLTADGGSRGNPGPAGYGAVVTENGKIVAELFDVIGVATNNVAEYNGLLAGLAHIHQLDKEATVEVAMDSKLVVEQMSGRWQIKHADMRDLAKQCRDAHTPSLVTYSWIPRDDNSHADRLANKALDGGSAHKPAAVIQQNYLTDRLRSAEIPTFIYFVRHGETVLTPTRKFSGTGVLDPELMQDGLDQAELVAEEAVKLGAEVLIASPLNRTRQTAEAIARTTGLEIIFDEAWFELSFGSWDGKSIEEVKEEEPDAYQAWLNSTAYAPGGGESWDQATVRIEEALEKLVAEYPGKKIIVVTHNGVIKTAVRLAIGAPSEAVFHVDAAPCSISSISIWPSDGLRAVRSVNERGHLR
ncbi:bifunctional RNase H/acid phosphatase [Candidatus Planktophila versatilis]|uniref:Probable phosphoglycerate mutase n=1 Tax=Candidatus Planktophila versatilis TaxID=1884905 RepID=A0ABM6MDC4_9ACTN|nr:bifunctional RNase H/acid phosphatase [Candidatus Planktophila versatilis]ASY16900.1 probable phosphoglycerate mutase [Candidatus Planktophila versatilis]